ncbi:MAG: hypothetical protein RL385_1917 [Pseudomonadota bacterium]
MPTAARAHSLEPGAPIPDVSLRLEDGFELALNALRGKLLVLYFCREADGPDCLREARGQRDRHPALQRRHSVVLGVSPQDVVALRSLRTAESLPFELVSDPQSAYAEALGVSLTDAGPHVLVVGRDGRLVRHFRGADPDAHVGEVLALASDAH